MVDRTQSQLLPKQYRFPYQKREELPVMKELKEEERPTHFQRISKALSPLWGWCSQGLSLSCYAAFASQCGQE